MLKISFEPTLHNDELTKYVLFAEIQCGNITLPNSNATNAGGAKDDVINIRCDDGYHIQETSSESYATTCQTSGIWSPYYTCRRKSHI